MATNDQNDVAVAVGCIVTGVGAVAVIAAGAALEGFVLRLLWGWHLTPVVNIPAPSIAVCIGLAALASALQNPPVACKSDEKSAGGRALAALFLRPVLLLFIGWVAYLFAR